MFFILALDQGTTSSRAISQDAASRRNSAQRKLRTSAAGGPKR
jgi:glycerol kinase